MQKWMARFVGFVAAVALFVLAAFVLFAILSDVTGERLIPRGIGWLIAPIAVGIAGARFAEVALPKSALWIRSPNGPLKYYAAGALLWIAAVWCYIFVFDPFGSYWTSAEWAFIWKLMLTPVAFAALCGIILNWLRPKAE